MKQATLMVLFLIGVTLLVHRQSLTGGFIYDDQRIIVKNPLIRHDVSWIQFFRSPYWGESSTTAGGPKGGLYRPLTMVSFALNYRLAGLQSWSYHAGNLLLHIAVCVALYFLFLHFGLGQSAASFACFIFALLPVHTEAISSIVGRAELLSALFVCLAWLLLGSKPTTQKLLWGFIAFGLALLSKENAVAFVPALVLTDYYKSPKSFAPLAHERKWVWSGVIGVLGLYLFWRFVVLGSMTQVGGTPYFLDRSLGVRMLTMAHFFWAHYIRPLVFGGPLSADFTRPQVADLAIENPLGWIALLSLMGLLVYAIYGTWRKHRPVAFGVLMFFVLIFPVAHALTSLEVIGAERFLYLPSVGYALIVGIALERLWVRKRSWGIVALTSLGICYGVQAYERDAIWKSEATFWSAAVRDAPQSPRSWNGLGVVRLHEKDYAQAQEYFIKAMELNPQLLDAHYNLSLCFLLSGDARRARVGFTYLLGQQPGNLDVLHKLAVLEEQAGKKAAALRYYERMHEIDPLDQGVQQKIAGLRGVKL